ncbi:MULTISPECIES: T9SS type A sorting domain-containing protein [Winogradskyella]|uniref:T9SS type A sorting domain-containing protein n=1 Tax=Winogradskyella TaxID=286104 RepID=UPI0015CDEC77|nr:MULTISPECIES: T9SS type A sorting domain-containing protein [Winogradskyella]QXP78432.1 T9SS type A sorting domain-containing protein [Winogradskyella sp. HaHa_3_26]
MKKHILFLIFLLLPILLLQAQWEQTGADIDGEALEDLSGGSVCLNSDGSILAIGAIRNEGNGSFAGHTRIYQNQNGNWIQIGDDIDSEEANDGFGASVSLNSDGSILAIGGKGNDANGMASGHVRIFENINDTWFQVGNDIDGEAAFDSSGISISLNSDGSIVAIGASGNDGNGPNSGHVRVYENQNDTWVQIGDDIDGEAAGDLFGRAVSLNSDGSILAIGAPNNDGNGEDSGHARIYQNQENTWVQIGDDIDGEASGDFFHSVSLSSDGSIVAIGGQGNDGSASASGHVRIFENISGTWSQIGNDINGEAAFDNSGISTSLNSDGSVVAIGAIGNDGNGEFSGHVRVYQNLNGLWTKVGMDIDGEAENDMSGNSVSLSSNGSIVAIGARLNDGNGEDSGHVRVFNNSTLSVEDFKSTNISIYPNPTEGIVFINEDRIHKIELIDMIGRSIYVIERSNKIDLSGKEKGIYILRVHTEKGIGVVKVILR